MNAILFIKKYLSAGLIASLLVGTMLLVFPAGAVAAATPVPNITPAPGTQANQATNRNQRLEAVYQRDQKVLANQGKILSKLNTIISKAQTVIANLKARGLDTSSLEQALTGFQGQIVTGQTYYNNANSVLTTHSGFDTTGVVVDPVQARTTLQTARQDFVSFRQSLQSALKNLRQTIREFRQANRPNKHSPSTPVAPTAPASQS